jgi:glyoxylase-like metal-dependent hydrolase (beta-lactamase superfamily II)
MPWHAERTRARLSRAGLAPSALDRVVAAHYDLDHVGAPAALDVDAPVYAADPDAAILEGLRRPSLVNHEGPVRGLPDPLLDRSTCPSPESRR